MDKVWVFFGCVVLIMAGNQLGDQATLRDCATQGNAHMVGGGDIECSVKRSTK